MKNKIVVITLIILSIILSGVVEVYAEQAYAYASVLIIIPPKEEKAEDKAQEKEEGNTYAKNDSEESEETKQ